MTNVFIVSNICVIRILLVFCLIALPKAKNHKTVAISQADSFPGDEDDYFVRSFSCLVVLLLTGINMNSHQGLLIDKIF